jgi:hypothetical protein
MEERKTSFLIKDIDHDYWRKVKIRALKRDLTLREFVLLCINSEVARSEKEGS